MLSLAARVDRRGLARLAIYLVVVWAVGIVWCLGRVRADVDEALLGLGADLARLDRGALLSSEVLQLNGARLRITTAMHDASLEDVLDGADARCRERDGRLEEQLQETLGRDGEALSPVVRAQGETRGYVACFGMRMEMTPESVALLAQRFLDTGDLTSIGTLHYVYARASETGTHVVTVESAGPVRPLEMFPAEGDAPGADPAIVARPAGMRRLLSADVEARPYGIAAYSVTRDAGEVLNEYRADLARRGWHEHTHAAWSDARGEGSIVAERDGAVVAVIASRDEGGEIAIAVLTTPTNEQEVSP
ncbi:hypothetical protein [Sandaracinus amylolyticus]|uniref:hypothetical protein n=1 Tax=Sandaracinus amylolyticus TaxID=927083 RepID=UPI001F2C8693|nr:hypothetical protein [Sandaracinus amylolyticus]UJR83812.1 Hypothetical protein I5071_58830 [Sandaracinus amylolyticus]